MPRDFFDPTPEQQVIVLVDASTLHKAERLIESCEHCNREGAEIPFDKDTCGAGIEPLLGRNNLGANNAGLVHDCKQRRYAAMAGIDTGNCLKAE